MSPTLRDGEEVEVRLDGAGVRPGDVVLFLDGGFLLLHRVIALRRGALLTQGDGAARPDPPVPRSHLLGRALVPRRAALAMRRAAVERARALGRAVIRALRP